MHSHDCRCVTDWSDTLGHPVYLAVCGTHKHQVPSGWLLEKKPTKKREPVHA